MLAGIYYPEGYNLCVLCGREIRVCGKLEAVLISVRDEKCRLQGFPLTGHD